MSPRVPLLAVLTLLLVPPGMAQQPPPPKKPAPDAAPAKANGPKKIGAYDNWIAATHPEAGQPVCYAFTRALTSTPTLPGRGGVVLTVTQRPTGRDAVAMEAGFAYAPNAAVTVQADQTGLEFYTSQRAAFARNGHEAVAAFKAAGRAVAHSPGPRDTKVTDTFSLKGFTAAYEAISKACPPK